MEGSNSRAEITRSKCGAPIGKPPTRLQKRAPAALRLDEITSARNLEACLTSANCVIPLLSPLVLSPRPCEAEQRPPPFVTGGNNVQQGRVEQACDLSVSAAMGGWQHPAASALAEPSTLFAFFQTQCSLVQPTPTQ